MGAGKKKPAGRPKSAPAPPGDAAAPRTLSCSLKSKKGGRQLEVAVQVPRSTPDSVLNIAADESGLSVDTGKWGGGYACKLEWPAPYAGKVRAGKDIEVSAGNRLAATGVRRRAQGRARAQRAARVRCRCPYAAKGGEAAGPGGGSAEMQCGNARARTDRGSGGRGVHADRGAVEPGAITHVFRSGEARRRPGSRRRAGSGGGAQRREKTCARRAGPEQEEARKGDDGRCLGSCVV